MSEWDPCFAFELILSCGSWLQTNPRGVHQCKERRNKSGLTQEPSNLSLAWSVGPKSADDVHQNNVLDYTLFALINGKEDTVYI